MTHRPVIIAHRGFTARAPENSLDAFWAARKLQADGIECDIRRCASGEFLIHHDPKVNGVELATNTRNRIIHNIPTLEQTLEFCTDWFANVEIKNDPNEPGYDNTEKFAADIAAIVRQFPQTKVLLSSFDFGVLQHLARVAPDIERAYLVMDPREVATWIPRSKEIAATALHPWDGVLTPALLEQCHQEGLHVNVWTVNEPARKDELTSWGVDGIITDTLGDNETAAPGPAV